MRLPIVSLVLLLAAGQAGAQTRLGRFDRLPGDPLLAIIDHIPSFAGMWVDSTRTFHGSLTNLKDSTSLREMLELHLSARPKYADGPNGKVVIERAKYTFAQLFDWKCTIERAVSGVDGVQGAGVRERLNKVLIGVFKPEAAAGVRKIVKGLNIPLDALDVELEEKMSFE